MERVKSTHTKFRALTEMVGSAEESSKLTVFLTEIPEFFFFLDSVKF